MMSERYFAKNACGLVRQLVCLCPFAQLDVVIPGRPDLEEGAANKNGVRDHPALKHELSNRAFVVRTLHRLGLDVERVGRVGRPAGSFRRADAD
jgi:hypothetical protein